MCVRWPARCAATAISCCPGLRYPFRVSSGQGADGNGTRVHLNIDPGRARLSADLDGVLAFEARAPRFEGAVTLAAPAGLKADGDAPITPWRISAKVKADPSGRAAGADRGRATARRSSALKLPAAATSASARRRCCAPRCRRGSSMPTGLSPKTTALPSRSRMLPALRALMSGDPATPDAGANRIQRRADHAGRAPVAGYCRRVCTPTRKSWTVAPAGVSRAGRTRVSLSGAGAQAPRRQFQGALNVESPIRTR